MNKNILSLGLSAIALVASCVAIGFHFLSSQKIGYVRSKELFDGYVGMKEAVNNYQTKVKTWQANLDTLKREYDSDLRLYELEAAKLPIASKKAKDALLEKKRQNIEEYEEAILQKAEEEDKQMVQGVMNQINSFVKTYAEDQGYELILGTTAGGNILYGKEAIDITQPLLKKLNADYQGN